MTSRISALLLGVLLLFGANAYAGHGDRQSGYRDSHRYGYPARHHGRPHDAYGYKSYGYKPYGYISYGYKPMGFWPYRDHAHCGTSHWPHRLADYGYRYGSSGPRYFYGSSGYRAGHRHGH